MVLSHCFVVGSAAASSSQGRTLGSVHAPERVAAQRFIPPRPPRLSARVEHRTGPGARPIRSVGCRLESYTHPGLLPARDRSVDLAVESLPVGPVSYTHLTLPTKRIV